jgi:hypothetical protein
MKGAVKIFEAALFSLSVYKLVAMQKILYEHFSYFFVLFYTFITDN